MDYQGNSPIWETKPTDRAQHGVFLAAIHARGTLFKRMQRSLSTAYGTLRIGRVQDADCFWRAVRVHEKTFMTLYMHLYIHIHTHMYYSTRIQSFWGFCIQGHARCISTTEGLNAFASLRLPKARQEVCAHSPLQCLKIHGHLLYGPQELPISWSHIPDIATVSDT